MDIKKSFSKVAHHPKLKQLEHELVDLLYGTLFRLQKGSKLTSDTLCIVKSIPAIDRPGEWGPHVTEKRHYVAKQNEDGTWDAQRISRMNGNDLQRWTCRQMEIARGSLEDVRDLFATINQVVSPTGRGFALNNLDDTGSCKSHAGNLKMEYTLEKLGNYREHPFWAATPDKKPDQRLTP